MVRQLYTRKYVSIVLIQLNVPGEILTKGPNVLLGYYKNEEDTGQTIDKDGWFHTGDLGLMDEDGNVFIKGRSKNMLLGSNGQNTLSRRD